MSLTEPKVVQLLLEHLELALQAETAVRQTVLHQQTTADAQTQTKSID
jgi:hypothetical protein